MENNDLISRSALLEGLRAPLDYLSLYLIRKIVNGEPAVDAVEVVRCKDCVKRDQAFRCIALYYGFNPRDDWFCAEGERDNAEVEG